MRPHFLELLSPAKDLECGVAAINAGADAVYIGGPHFGAREDAGNPVTDIAKLASFAHIFSAKVYVTMNTILFERELEEARTLAWRLYEAGADAIIVQDMAFMEMDLPPIPLHASTQTNNIDKEKVKFLEKTGFKRVVLARELEINKIREICSETDVEIECFVHGSLCVGLSGNCYMSCAVGGRSANRGACAQPCRKKYSLVDANGKTVVADKHLLSLKDLYLSDSIPELAEAGVNSLKIEGRLKEANYVKNVTAWYRREIDKYLENREGIGNNPRNCQRIENNPETCNKITRPSYGKIYLGFEPDPRKSFNRGVTDYFLHGRKRDIASFDTPKSMGEKIGTVISVAKDRITVDTASNLSNNDGLMFIDDRGETRGFKVNSTNGKEITPESVHGLRKGTVLYRNYDHQFTKELAGAATTRKLPVNIVISTNQGVLVAEAVSPNGIRSSIEFKTAMEPAENRQKSKETIKTQFSKSGETPFEIVEVETGGAESWFFRASELNAMRRELLDSLKTVLEKNREEQVLPPREIVEYPEKVLDYSANVSNPLAMEFYRKRGATEIGEAFELMENTDGLKVMTTKHCLRYMTDNCPRYNKKSPANGMEELYLTDGERRYRLEFDCKRCVMLVYK